MLLARLLVCAGHSPDRLWREFRDICKGLPEPKRHFDPQRLEYLADLTHVIARWWSDPRYLDARGKPRALSMRAEEPSFGALTERDFPGENPNAIADSLIKMGSVRQDADQYVATSRTCIYPEDDARLHGLWALLGMLGTVDHNVSGGKPKLFERTVMNPNFPVSALPAFYRHLEEVADGVLQELNNQMLHYEQSPIEGPRIRLAVGICAFENPVWSDSLDGSVAPHAPRARIVRRRRRKER